MLGIISAGWWAVVFVTDFSLLDEFLLLQFVCEEVSGPCVQFCAIALKLF